MTSLRPRNDFVLIQPDQAERMRGVLFVPASSIHMPERGTVIACGPGYLLQDGTRADLNLKEGDRVEFVLQPGRFKPVQLELGAEALESNRLASESAKLADVPYLDKVSDQYYLIKEDDIWAVVLDEPAPEMMLPLSTAGEGESAVESPAPAVADPAISAA